MADFYRTVGKHSVLTSVPELAGQLGNNLEPSPSGLPVAVFGEGHRDLGSLAVGTAVFWWPNHAQELSSLLGLDLQPSSLPQVPGVLPGFIVDEADFAVPQTITATQIRLWLFRNGVSLEAVQSAIDAIPDEAARGETRIQWEYAPYVERSHPFINALGQSLGLTSEQIDQAFVEAARL
jgi:hypothetical protein